MCNPFLAPAPEGASSFPIPPTFNQSQRVSLIFESSRMVCAEIYTALYTPCPRRWYCSFFPRYRGFFALWVSKKTGLIDSCPARNNILKLEKGLYTPIRAGWIVVWDAPAIVSRRISSFFSPEPFSAWKNDRLRFLVVWSWLREWPIPHGVTCSSPQ